MRTIIIKDEGMNQKSETTYTKKIIKLRKETNWYERDKIRGLTREFKDSCSQRMCMASLILNMEACGSRVKDFKIIF